MISGASAYKYFETEEESPEPIYCDNGGIVFETDIQQFLVMDMRQTVENALYILPTKKNQIENALFTELQNSCYTIVDCATEDPNNPGFPMALNEVTLDDIELMADAVIAEWTATLENLQASLPTLGLENYKVIAMEYCQIGKKFFVSLSI